MHDGPFLEPLAAGMITLFFAPFILLALTYLEKAISERRWNKSRGTSIRIVALVAFLVAQITCVAATWISCNRSQFERTATITCASNLKMLNLAMDLYVADNDATYPPTSTWGDAVTPYIVSYAPTTYRCRAGSTPYSYAMNDQLSFLLQEKTKQPAQTVLLFEHDSQNRNGHGNRGDVVSPRHENVLNFAFADGHVKYLTTFESRSLHWQP